MAKYGVTNVAGGGGIGSDELSVTKDYVLNGKTYVGTDTNDEIGTGTMANNGTTANQSLNAGGSFQVKKGYHAQDFSVNANSLASQTSGTAVTSDILSGKTAWVNGNKITGNIAIQSILSFSCTPYSASQIIFTWQNPSRGPFSGVIIVGKTGGYPTNISDGTRYYKGFGNNAGASGVSNAIVEGFSANVAYYFKVFSYSTKNGGEWLSDTIRIANTTINVISQVITTSTIWTVPANVHIINVFCVGGGGGGYPGNDIVGGTGGGGGYTSTTTATVTPGQQIAVTIGAGGDKGNHSMSWRYPGGNTTFGNYAYANGGGVTYPIGSPGGSGGGGSSYSYDPGRNKYVGGFGGSNGGNGGSSSSEGGQGQGTTTRAFGENYGSLYSGGGGAGSRGTGATTYLGGIGGTGGGGNGGNWNKSPTSGSDATPNTGGGGGGGGGYDSDDDGLTASSAGKGASGICIIKYVL